MNKKDGQIYLSVFHDIKDENMKKKMVVSIVIVMGIISILVCNNLRQKDVVSKSNKTNVHNAEKGTDTGNEKSDNDNKENNSEQSEAQDEKKTDKSSQNIDDSSQNEEETEVDQDGNVIIKYSDKDTVNKKNNKSNSQIDNKTNNEKNEQKNDNKKDEEKNDQKADDKQEENTKLEDGGIELPIVPVE